MLSPLSQYRAPRPSSPTYRRLTELAAHRGLVLVPAIYPMVFSGLGGAVARASIVPDAAQGPFFVTTIPTWNFVAAGGTSDTNWELQIRSGSRLLTEGRVRGVDVFVIQGLLLGGYDLPGPIVVKRSDILTFEASVDLDATTLAVDNVMHVCGYHLREMNGQYADKARADQVAQDAIDDGEFAALGIITTDNQTDGLAASMHYEWVRLGYTTNGTGALTSYAARVGNVDIFPQSLGSESDDVGGNSYGLLMQCNLNHRRGDRVEVRQNASGGFVAKLSLVGRRFSQAA